MRLVLISCAIAVLFLNPSVRGQQVGDSTVTQPEPLKEDSTREEHVDVPQVELERHIGEVHAAMEWWARDAVDFVINSERFGLYLSASQIPSGGRLLIFYNGAETRAISSCSGVLISPRHFLTAAHCLCGQKRQAWYSPTAAECAQILDRLSLQVFFPAAGLFEVEVEPAVHPEYRSAEEEIERGKTKVADLAVLKLKDEVLLPVPTVGSLPDASRYLLVSYGTFSFSEASEGSAYEWGIQYQDGVKQISTQRPPKFISSECGRAAAADTFCTHFNDLYAESGSEQDAGACGGDSGSPLFALGPSKHSVMGITSYYSPLGTFSCDGSGSRFNHFVDIDRYADWIADQISDAPEENPQPLRCAEAVLEGPGTFYVRPNRGLLSITSYTAEVERPSVTIEGIPIAACRAAKEFGVVSCPIEEQSVLAISLADGFAQISICGSGEDLEGGASNDR